jgi:peptidoglycan/LPS O-acetylase OafA/YrhL
VLVPYLAIVAGYAVAWGEIPWASLLLVSNFGIGSPDERTMLPFLYWFVEVYVQLMLLLAALFLLPPARRAVRARPFGFALGLLAAAVAARAVGPALWDLGGRQIFTLPWVAPLAGFGWCAAVARDGRQRRLVLGLAALVMPALAWDGGNWVGSWVRYGTMFAVIAVLLYVPSLPVPAVAVPATLAVAAASYPIYLVHRFVPEIALAPLEPTLPPAVFAAVAVAGGVLLGIAAWRAQRAVGRWSRAGAPLRRPARSA